MRGNKLRLFGNNYVNIQNGELMIGSHFVKKINDLYDTPTFIFLQDKIQENITYIQSVFSEVFDKSLGFYSVKSNFLKPVLETVNEMGFGAEIITLPEFHLLEQINFPRSRIIAGGPYLPSKFIQKIFKAQVPYIVIYDLDQIPQLNRIYEIEYPNGSEYCPQILLKFRTNKYTSRHGIPQNPENYSKIKALFANYKNLKFMGILSHYGTRLKSEIQYKENISNIVSVVKNLKNFADLDCKIIDFGGGFPSADSIKREFLVDFLESMKKEFEKNDIQDYTLFYEPGRFIIEDTGFCLCKVIRFDKLTQTAFLNVGNNLIPKFMKSSLRFYNASRITDSAKHPVDFMGYIPSDQDILIKHYNFTETILPDDIIVIANVGAYALTWSTRFPYSPPNILFFKGNEINLFQSCRESNKFTLTESDY